MSLNKRLTVEELRMARAGADGGQSYSRLLAAIAQGMASCAYGAELEVPVERLARDAVDMCDAIVSRFWRETKEAAADEGVNAGDAF